VTIPELNAEIDVHRNIVAELRKVLDASTDPDERAHLQEHIKTKTADIEVMVNLREHLGSKAALVRRLMDLVTDWDSSVGSWERDQKRMRAPASLAKSQGLIDATDACANQIRQVLKDGGLL
jgi:hypothetical protein